MNGPTGLCVHVWISNSGLGGDPIFRPNRHMSALPLMHVICRACGTRTWLTEEQWANATTTTEAPTTTKGST